MRRKTFSVLLAQPYAEMLESEARASGRSTEAHVAHILGRRYDNLIRICGCGYFLYAVTDDLVCVSCGALCCPYDSLPIDQADLCFKCAAKSGIDVTGKGGFRAASEGKV